MNVREAAASLCVSPETIRRLIRSGRMPAEKAGSSHAFNVQATGGSHFTVRALAECARCSPEWIQCLIRRDVIRARRVGRVYRIPKEEGLKFMEIRL
jgi:excisionase family DNA binding protein